MYIFETLLEKNFVVRCWCSSRIHSIIDSKAHTHWHYWCRTNSETSLMKWIIVRISYFINYKTRILHELLSNVLSYPPFYMLQYYLKLRFEPHPAIQNRKDQTSIDTIAIVRLVMIRCNWCKLWLTDYYHFDLVETGSVFCMKFIRLQIISFVDE